MAATSVDEYLAALPDDRRAAVTRLRDTLRARLPVGYEEGIQYGMIGYFVPHSRYPDGYHCDRRQPVPFVGVASQKSHVGVYLFCIYTDPALYAWFVEESTKAGLKLDMGKGCVRFKKMDQIPFELLGETIARAPVDEFLRHYEAQIPPSARKKKK